MGVELGPVETLCQRHLAEGSSLVMLLQDIQSCYRYLPPEALQDASHCLNVPLARLYGLATFYLRVQSDPSREARGLRLYWHRVSCPEAPVILDSLRHKLDVDSGETTEDGLFTLLSVNCLVRVRWDR